MSRRPATVFTIRLKATRNTDSARALRALLKTTLRRHRLRCISAHAEQSDPVLRTEKVEMSADLEHLRNYAATNQGSGFDVPFFRCSGVNGDYLRSGRGGGGPLNGQRLACDVNDHLSGWLKWEQNVPTYVVGRTSDGFAIPARGQLGDLNEDRWPDGKDPWQRVDLLPFWNVESREVLLFTATSGGSRKAVATLVGTFADNLLAHPQDVGRVPLIELSVESYKSRHGNRVFAPIFDVVDWIERPDAVRRVLPAPVKMLDLVALPAPTSAPAPVLLSTPTPTPAPTKSKRSTKSAAADVGDHPYDDSIPL